MRLKRPGDLRRGIDTLNALAREVGQIDLGAKSSVVRLSWLRWWDSADQRLRDVFVDDDLITDLYRTQAVVRALEPSRPSGGFVPVGNDGATTDLLRRECDVWGKRLHDAARQLEQLEAFVSRPGRVVVLDTSAFIEGGDFWEQDWPTITFADDDSALGAGPLPVRLIVPIIVIEEMDIQKRHTNKRVAATARQALSYLWQLTREQSGARRLDNRVTVEILLDDRTHARLPVNDTEIVDRAAYLRDLFAPRRSVYLVAGDYSMLFRAEELGLRPIQVGDRDPKAAPASVIG
jgi:PIN domain